MIGLPQQGSAKTSFQRCKDVGVIHRKSPPAKQLPTITAFLSFKNCQLLMLVEAVITVMSSHIVASCSQSLASLLRIFAIPTQDK